jgi:hypothetical protein
MPPAFAHCCSGEGSEPGCKIVAQPARVDSIHSRASPVGAILTIQLAWRRIAMAGSFVTAIIDAVVTFLVPVVMRETQRFDMAKTRAESADTAARDAAIDSSIRDALRHADRHCRPLVRRIVPLPIAGSAS